MQKVKCNLRKSSCRFSLFYIWIYSLYILLNAQSSPFRAAKITKKEKNVYFQLLFKCLKVT